MRAVKQSKDVSRRARIEAIIPSRAGPRESGAVEWQGYCLVIAVSRLSESVEKRAAVCNCEAAERPKQPSET